MLHASDHTLLIVEDDWTLRNLMAMDLRRQGYKVFTAESGEQALNVLQENDVDLIVSDVRMPNGDGLTLLEKIRAHHPRHPGLLFVTGYAEISSRECRARGALEVLPKPFERQQLRDAVSYWMGILTEQEEPPTNPEHFPSDVAADPARPPSRGSHLL